MMGRVDEAEANYRAALELSKDDAGLKADAQFALGKLNRLRGDFEAALDWLAQTKEARTMLEDTAGLAQALIETGMVLYRKGEYARAREPLNEGLALAHPLLPSRDGGGDAPGGGCAVTACCRETMVATPLEEGAPPPWLHNYASVMACSGLLCRSRRRPSGSTAPARPRR